MGYCTPNDPTEEPLSMPCPECDGVGLASAHDGELVVCHKCEGWGEVIFEQE